MDDEEILAQHVKSLEASVAYFAPGNSKDRERFVVSAFVENLRISFAEAEMTSPNEDPPDVVFRDARFEIKEILDPERRRHDEYKAALAQARTLTDPKDVFRMFMPRDEFLDQIYRRCAQTALALIDKYPPAVRSDLDLLFYVNLTQVFNVIEAPYPDASDMENAGWRSVSFVMGQRSCCFYARADAPSFIKQTIGRVSHRHPRQGGI